MIKYIIMDPRVSDIAFENSNLTFKVSNINVSLANSLRRIILSEIPTVVFRTAPHARNNSIISINTTRLNNEIIKQRLACIPVHITDITFPIEDYIVECDKKNESETTQYVTTEDFVVRNVKTDTVLSAAETRKMFPPDPITGDFIDFVRIRPKLSKTLDGEHLKMSCTLSVGKVQENGSYNVVSTCSYRSTIDVVRRTDIWSGKAKEYKKGGKSAPEIEDIKNDWLLLEGKRITLPNSFTFIIESVGVFAPMKIVEMACSVMLNKVEKFSEDIQTKENMIVPSKTTMENCYDIILEGEDYTLGCALEYLLYASYYDTPTDSNKILTFCGFTKPHPHIDVSIIRIAFKHNTDKGEILNYLGNVTTKALEIFNSLKKDFTAVA